MTVHESLTRQARRCVDHLGTVDPGSHEFNMTLENMERLMAIRQFVAECLDTEEPAEAEATAANVVKIDPIEEVRPVAPAPVFEKINEPAPCATEEKTYSKEEVRAALGAARAKGINVTELMKKFGVDKFPAFPAGRYGELMDQLEGMMT